MATSIRLDHETEHRLNVLSHETGRSKAFYIRELIQNGLEDIEDYYLASTIREKVRSGKERLHSLDEIRKECGMDD